jgi:hypothetical protein
MTTLIETLASISVDHWDDLADDLERAATAAKPIDTDVFAAIDLVRAEWIHITDAAVRPRCDYEKWRLSRVASHVKRVLDGLIADMVRAKVA